MRRPRRSGGSSGWRTPHLSFLPALVNRGILLKHLRSDKLCRIEFFQLGCDAVGTRPRCALANCMQRGKRGGYTVPSCQGWAGCGAL